MADMDTEHGAVPPLQAIFDAAQHFGLTAEEVWASLDESLSEAGAEATVTEYLDECTGVLAARILSKYRRERSSGSR